MRVNLQFYDCCKTDYVRNRRGIKVKFRRYDRLVNNLGITNGRHDVRDTLHHLNIF